ncbi:epoxide hydrolase [Aspergillus lucknowensis]|uniref:Alpha/beta-hydrolase n=1 Tax=Aspergillus lucknowensis TaxID=176173 RepID=A0ABR4M1L9_9EURO
MAAIKPFTIEISDSRLQRLQEKLALTEFPNQVEDLNTDAEEWSRGVPLREIKRLTTYWKDDFDWRKVEARLNGELPQYTTDIEIDGFGSYNIHFVHQRSTGAEERQVIPLLFLHGWPGSFLEVSKILPLLVNAGENELSFHAVAPSLIDFGFSEASSSKAFGMDQHAEAYHKLMLTLGYEEYVIQAGDLGYMISRLMSSKYGAEHIKALHTNSAVPAEPTAESHPELHTELQNDPLPEFDKAGLTRTATFFKDGMGYVALLTTRPQTIGYGLTDSPVGILAWIYEKLHDWTDGYPWTDEEILTWVCMHYFSRAGPAAPGNLYFALERNSPVPGNPFAVVQGYVPDVPLGISRFAKDLVLLPRAWNRTLGPVLLQREYGRGGHFGAWECPAGIVGDLRGLVREARVWS